MVKLELTKHELKRTEFGDQEDLSQEALERHPTPKKMHASESLVKTNLKLTTVKYEFV